MNPRKEFTDTERLLWVIRNEAKVVKDPCLLTRYAVVINNEYRSRWRSSIRRAVDDAMSAEQKESGKA